jgi:hypothetical protein
LVGGVAGFHIGIFLSVLVFCRVEDELADEAVSTHYRLQFPGVN